MHRENDETKKQVAPEREPTVPPTDQMDGHARFHVRQLRKCLARLGYLGADATNVDIWDIACYFRERNKLFGPRMRGYTKPMEKKMKILIKKAKQRRWQASPHVSAECEAMVLC